MSEAIGTKYVIELDMGTDSKVKTLYWSKYGWVVKSCPDIKSWKTELGACKAFNKLEESLPMVISERVTVGIL